MARLAGPGITFLVALGFQLSGFENLYVALALWAIAGLWMVGAFLTWRPVRERVRRRRTPKPQGVLTDIEHRAGCPENPARQEAWTRTRERDGMEIKVGKCKRKGSAVAEPPATAPADRLAQLYRDGERLRQDLQYALRSRESFDESRDEGQTEWHKTVRAWNQVVGSSLYGEKGSAFRERWGAAASIPDPHPTLGLIEPTISFGELIGFMNDKLACLKGIIGALGDPASESEEKG